jgi:glycosyltransferase involved in cell wall biosynthesis
MNIAFYAPLKAPDHRTPSGDRALGRLLLSALRAGGHQVHLASRLRSFEREGDAGMQAHIRTRAARVTRRLIERYQHCDPEQRPQLWFTYHLYHKAPDLIGPEVSRALGIPYVVAEASHAPKQAGGMWDAGYRSAALAIKSAAMIITLNYVDMPCVSELLGDDKALRRLAPFIDIRPSTRALHQFPGAEHWRTQLSHLVKAPVAATPVIACVAMMRDGDKLASYRMLAQALTQISDRPWQLLVIGDGPAQEQVVEVMRPLASRVLWAGQISPQELAHWLCGCDLYVWPAVNEAWSMAILEAGAAALPSVAGDEGGVSAVIEDGHTGILTPARDSAAFAVAVASLLDDEAMCQRMGAAAREKIRAEHDLAAASRQLNDFLGEVVA